MMQHINVKIIYVSEWIIN